MEFRDTQNPTFSSSHFLYDTIYFQSPDEYSDVEDDEVEDEEDESFDDEANDLDDLHEIQVDDDLSEPDAEDDDHLPDDDLQ